MRERSTDPPQPPFRKGGSREGVGASLGSPPCEGGVGGGSDFARSDVLKRNVNRSN